MNTSSETQTIDSLAELGSTASSQAVLSKKSWSNLLEIDWSIKSYEVVALTFALICVILVKSLSPLPFSFLLVQMLVAKNFAVIGITYVAAIFVILIQAARHANKNGWHSLKSKDAIISLIEPYFSLNFLMTSIRRGLSFFGVLYFFLHLKHVILWVNFSNYDLFLWNLDRTLHFGMQPSIWLMQTLGTNHEAAIFFDWIYIVYFSYISLVSILFLLNLKGRLLSDRFFTACCLLWSIGGLAYTAMPADGPCYAMLGEYSINSEQRTHYFKFPVAPDAPADYISNYKESKIWSAKSFQDRLWDARHGFITGQKLPGMFYGIAAMPSLHVAVVVTFAIFLFYLSSIAGILGVIYAIMVAIASVFLQWHYAVDGYAGTLLAVFCVLFSRFLTSQIGRFSGKAKNL